MTVAIYVRVSTEEQVKEGFSISAQREKLKAFCKVHDWKEYKFYVDEGISAKDTNRTQLQLMLDHIKKGMIKTVLVYRLDRLTRSVLDLYQLLDIFEENNCKFKSATEVYDTTTAMGRMFITLVAAMAQWERENLGERVRMGQIEKARQGRYSAKAPFGFNKDENDKLIINNDEKQVILTMIEKIQQGYSIRQLANYLDNSGIPPIRGYQWHMTSILTILKNPAIYGATKWLDEIIENTHEGIITKKEHDHLIQIFNERRNKKKRKVSSIFIYQMKLICPKCGNHLTCERAVYQKKDGTLSESNFYRCQPCAHNKRKAISVSERKLEKGFMKYMEFLQFDYVPDVKDDSQNEKETITKEIERIKKQREKYQKAWSNDLMTDEEFTERMQETKMGLDELIKKLNDIQPVTEQIDVENIKEIVNNFKLNWIKLEPKEKHQFLNMFIKEIHFQKNDSNVDVTKVLFY